MKPIPRFIRFWLIIRRLARKLILHAPVKARVLIIPGPSSPTRSFSFSFGLLYFVAVLLAASLLLNAGLLIGNIFVSADYASLKTDINTVKAERKFLEKNLSRLSGRVEELRAVIPKLLDVTEPGKGRNFDLFAVGGDDGASSQADVSKRLQAQVEQVDRDISISADVLQQVRSYLDENKRIFSKLPTLWPVQGGGYVTSEFGTRNSPFHFDRQERHKGADIAFYPGAPIVATADGSVMSTGYEKGFGNCLTILHAYGFMTRYAHCQSIKVMPGQPVRRGQVIATMGRTGRTTGYHLHYEIRIGREPLDPLPFMLKTPRGRQ